MIIFVAGCSMGKNVMEMEKMGMFDNYDKSYLEDMYFKCENICGPRGTGKTSFLKALMKYFGDIGEERLDSEPIEREHLSNYGKHPIIFLVLEMYSKYVSAWNGDLAAEDVFTKEFKGGNAQEFLVLLETLDVLMGNDVIDDGHLLLNADAKLWHDLGKSKNWYEVGMNRKAQDDEEYGSI